MFEELSLERGLRISLDALQLPEPTAVQSEVVPKALAGADLQVSAETGSGKTLAYLIPLIQRILSNTDKSQTGTLALVLVPTRELARQVLKQTRLLIDKTPLSAAGITGGADFKYQRSLLRKDPEIVVATPGRMLEHCQKHSAKLDVMQTLVLDEADRMLDMGFRDDVTEIAGFCAPERQTLMLSATLGHGGVKTIAKTLLKDPQDITVGTERQPHSSIYHQLILSDGQEHKDELLPALLQQGGYTRALVFGNKRTTAARLARLLAYKGLRCAALHGEMSTEERTAVMHQFHDGKIDIVCASDVAARGLDVPGIDLVVNYDVPFAGDDYLHRTGRTGRAGAKGLAVTLLTASEWNLAISIERYLGLDFERRTLPGLKARYTGPKKLKSNGKAAGKKKKDSKKTDAKKKSRKRNQKEKGKPSRPEAKPVKNDGFAPPKKKTSNKK